MSASHVLSGSSGSEIVNPERADLASFLEAVSSGDEEFALVDDRSSDDGRHFMQAITSGPGWRVEGADGTPGTLFATFASDADEVVEMFVAWIEAGDAVLQGSRWTSFPFG